jgi:hypothetical protein
MRLLQPVTLTDCVEIRNAKFFNLLNVMEGRKRQNLKKDLFASLHPPRLVI